MISFIQKDWKSHKIRVCAETAGMLISLIVALIIMVTTPLPPMILCYVLWEVASVLLLSAAVSRGSLGFSILYSGFLVVDGIGLTRTLLV
jgi:hypothetical protein